MLIRLVSSGTWPGYLLGRSRSAGMEVYEWSDRNLFAAFGLAAGLAVLSAAAGLRAYEGVLGLFLLAAMTAIAAWVYMKRPALGLASLIALGLLASVRLTVGGQSGLVAAYFAAPVVIACWFLNYIRRHRSSAIRSATVLPARLLIVFSGMAFVAGQYPWFPTHGAPLSAQLAALGVLVFSCCLFFVAADQLQDQQWLSRLTWLFLFVGGIRILLMLLSKIEPAIHPAALSEQELGSLFWTWLVALGFAQAVFNRNLNFVFRVGLLVIVGGALYLVLFDKRDWASGWLPACVALLAILICHRPRLFVPIYAVAGVAIGLSYFGQLRQAFWTVEQQYSFLTRVEAAKVLSEVISVNPILGLGPANYYHYVATFPILGWYVPFSSHNTYLDVVAQTGILGLASLLWFLCAVGWISLRLRKSAPAGFPRAYAYGVVGGLAGTVCSALLADWLLPFVYNVGLSGFSTSVLVWIFLGGLVALEQRMRRRLGDAI